jgi:hypothetical protein
LPLGRSVGTVFERFTDRARRVVVLAQEEARLLNHNYIGTEHILLGIIHEGDGIAATALESLGISLPAARAEVEEVIGHGGEAPSGHIPFTPRAKKVLELSLREALQLGHNYIGTEHILLGLVREGEGVAAQVLVKLGAELSLVRQQVIALVSGKPLPSVRPAPVRAEPQGATVCAFCGRDVWDVEHYVAGNAAVICEQCLILGRTVVEAARKTGHPVGQPLFLPPRVFGDAPSDQSTADIVESLGTVFASNRDRRRVASHLEDGERLAPLIDEAAARFPQVSETRVRVDRIRYVNPTSAQVRFTIMAGALGAFSFEGQMFERDRRWIVSRDTFCQVIAGSGVQCPPPTE